MSIFSALRWMRAAEHSDRGKGVMNHARTVGAARPVPPRQFCGDRSKGLMNLAPAAI
jgi:hypothetical protein